jgi:hypothetical protein
MNKNCISRKKIVGKTKLTSEPRRIAKPNPKTTPPRYIGFRLYWKKPSVTKFLGFSPLESNLVLFVKILVALRFMTKPIIMGTRPIRVKGNPNII